MKGKYKHKLIVTNTIIIFCFISIVYGLVYYFSVKEYKRHIEKNNLQITKQIGSVVDNRVLEPILSLPNLYFSDNEHNEALRKPMVKEMESHGLDVLNVNKKVNGIIQLNDYIIGLDIYYELNQLLFINGTIKNLVDPATRKEDIPYWFQRYKDTNRRALFIPTNHNTFLNTEVITYIYKLPLAYEYYETMIAIHVDSLALKKLLTSLKSEDKTKILGVVDQEGQLITSTSEDLEYNQLIINVLNDADSHELDESQFIYEKDNNKYIVAKVKSQYTSWYYVSLIPVEGFYALSAYMYLSLLVPAFFVIFGMGFVIVANNKLYSPMEKVFSVIRNIPYKKEEQEEKDEYSLLTNKLTYLVDEMEDLHHKIEVNQPAIFHSTIHRMLRGGIDVKSKHSYKEAGIELNKTHVLTFIIKITWNEEYNKLLALEYTLLERFQTQNKFNIYSIVEDNRISAIVNYDESYEIKDIYSYIQRVMSSCIKQENFVIAIGKFYPLLDGKIKESYHSANEALKYSFIKPSQHMIVYTNEEFDQYKTSGSSHQVIKKMEDYIRSSNHASILLTINGLIESLIVGNYSIEYCMNTLQDVASSIRRSFNEIGLNTDQLFGYDLREYYKHMESIMTYSTWLNEVIEFLFQKIKEQKADEAEVLLRDIKNIVDNNIYNDISLDLVADQLHMRYDTLSRTFKQMTGKTFSTYVKEVKLERAIDLVTGGEYTMGDISKKLGYSSTHYFIRLFKQAYGMTPKQYQIKMSKKD
ncbi:helix-turn-helix transcriptional regulator [Vallitalea okinawensis]|uniref:helix-turn-helix transcriptional regulator n=1 Tax=Vallitalea okinawensis TaxID=2078660 RepID=UPI000CFE2542|nr:AraC family transcriptional regulator [Vallitalea okinawensis]